MKVGKQLTVELRTRGTSADLHEASSPWQSFSMAIWTKISLTTSFYKYTSIHAYKHTIMEWSYGSNTYILSTDNKDWAVTVYIVHVCIGLCWAHRVSLCNDTKELNNVGVRELWHDMGLLEEPDPLLHWRIDTESLHSHFSHSWTLTPRSLVHCRKLPTATLIQDAGGGRRRCMQLLHSVPTYVSRTVN